MVGIILAFVGGRFTASSENPESNVAEADQERPDSPRSTRRARTKRLARASIPGAGAAEAINSAVQLRDLFKQDGNKGLQQLQASLAKMNSSELAELAADLADAHASHRGQPNWYEIPQVFSRWAEVDPEAALGFAKSAHSPFHKLALQHVITTIAQKDVRFALREAKKIENPMIAQQIKAQVMATLANNDPDTWLTEILSDPKNKLQYSSLSSYVGQWFQKDPVAAVARIERLPTHLLNQASAQIAYAWASKDSAAAMKWANSLDNFNVRNQAISAVINTIAKDNPDKAMQMAKDMPGGHRKSTLSAIYRTMAQTNPLDAFERALALTNSADRHAALNSVISGNGNGYSRWGGHPYMHGQAPTFTMEQLQSIVSRLPQGQLRDSALGQLSGHLMDLPISKTKQILSAYPLTERELMASNLINSIYSADPERALELYQDFPELKHGRYSSYYSSVLSSIAKINPEKAITLALEANSENERSNLLRNVMSTMAASEDPKKLVQYITSINEEKLRAEAISTTAAHWANTDPTAAINWAHSLPNEEKIKALSAIIPSMAGQNPQIAVKHYETLAAMTGGSDRRSTSASVASSIASSWSNYDPEAASAWAETIADETAQRYAVNNIISNWAKLDTDRAGQWLDSLPAGNARDDGVKSMVSMTSTKDPASAFAWAQTISNEQQRRHSLGSVVRNWKQTNPDKAHQAVENSSLTDKEYEYLVKQLK